MVLHLSCGRVGSRLFKPDSLKESGFFVYSFLSPPIRILPVSDLNFFFSASSLPPPCTFRPFVFFVRNARHLSLLFPSLPLSAYSFHIQDRRLVLLSTPLPSCSRGVRIPAAFLCMCVYKVEMRGDMNFSRPHPAPPCVYPNAYPLHRCGILPISDFRSPIPLIADFFSQPLCIFLSFRCFSSERNCGT